jgi:hypothetical protein
MSRTAALLGALAAALVLVPAAAATASPASIAWFYKPPTDGSAPAAVAAATTGQMILTKRDESFRDQLRAAGYGAPILQYVEAAYAHGPAGATSAGGPCDATFAPWGNNVAWDTGDFCRHLHPNESWFLHNGRGERLINGYYTGSHGVFYAMNPASPGWRQFYASRIAQALFGDAANPPLGYQGIFLDDVWLTRNQLLDKVYNADGVVRELGSDADYRSAVAGLIQAVRSAAAGRPVHANTDGNDHYAPLLDGTMREDFAGSWNNAYMDAAAIASVWATADRARADGKAMLLVSQGARDDLARMRFSYAAYLMAAGPGISFRYTKDSAAYREVWSYPEYALAIGTPAGARTLVAGSTWRRQFSDGVAVVHLAASGSQLVDLGGLHAAADGTLLSTVTLPARTGLVLRRAGSGTTFASVTPPKLSGAPAVGSVLSTTAGTWTVAPQKLVYAWLRCGAAGDGCSAISRATGSTYKLAAADAGKTLRSRVTATAGGVTATAVSAPTAAVAKKGARQTAGAGKRAPRRR